MQLQHRTLVLRGSLAPSVSAWRVLPRDQNSQTHVRLRSVHSGLEETHTRQRVEQWIRDGVLLVEEKS